MTLSDLPRPRDRVSAPARAALLGLAGLVLTALAAAGCRPTAPDAPPTDTVRAQLKQDPQSLTLIGKRDRYSEIVARLITDSLVQYDADLEMRPGLAESWEISDDNLSVVFRLRRGVTWHDGEPFTAHDVVFTVEKVLDPASEAIRHVSLFDDLESVEAVDDYTVRARYTKAYADFLEGWWLPIIPKHLADRDEDFLTGEFSRNPVGCGPFRFVEYRPGQRLVLEAYDGYWDGRPEIDRLVFVIHPDDRTTYQALLLGELDLMTATPEIWRQSRIDREEHQLARFVYYTNRVYYVGWNGDGSNPFFGDARVRRAMTSAIDRRGFADAKLEGLAAIGATTYHPQSVWTDPAVEPWPYDPAEAGRLLDEAGWTDADGDGIRDRDGEPFAFTLMIPVSPQQIVDDMALWIQEDLAAVGVRMEIDAVETRVFQERRRQHRFDASMASFTFTPVPDTYDLYHTTARGTRFNYVGLADAEVDRLLEEGRHALDTERRREIYRALQHRLHELEPLTCLFYFASPVLHHPRLEGLEGSPIDMWRIVPGARSWRWNRDAAGG